MVNKKKLTAGVAALVLCITGVTYGTLAYFTDKDTRANVITIGHVTGTLTETDEHMRDDNTTGKDYTNVKPGDVLDKDPTVTLDKESEDAYVRVSINYEGLTKEQALVLAGLSQRMVIITIMRYFLIKQEQSIHQKYSLKLLFQQNGAMRLQE